MISVIIATYNGIKYLKQQLLSIAEQSMPADEVIISDDCSTDDTVGLCHSFINENALSGWRVIKHTDNVGYCLNFYRALSEAKGDYIFFCDQDDVWDKNKIEKMVSIMEENSNISMLSCRYRLIDAKGNVDENLSVPHFEANFNGSIEKVNAESLIGHSFIRGCSLCMKKSLKKYIKNVELKDLLGHDWQIAMLSALSDGAYIINLPLMSYRCHENNASFSAKPVRLLEKRISGLTQSVEAHKYIADFAKDEKLKDKIYKFIRFEEKRIQFLNSKNILIFISLIFKLKQYNRYYAGNGIKVWLGDFVYAFKK